MGLIIYSVPLNATVLKGAQLCFPLYYKYPTGHLQKPKKKNLAKIGVGC